MMFPNGLFDTDNFAIINFRSGSLFRPMGLPVVLSARRTVNTIPPFLEVCSGISLLIATGRKWWKPAYKTRSSKQSTLV
jgi:hypothetical protein